MSNNIKVHDFRVLDNYNYDSAKERVFAYDSTKQGFGKLEKVLQILTQINSESIDEAIKIFINIVDNANPILRNDYSLNIYIKNNYNDIDMFRWFFYLQENKYNLIFISESSVFKLLSIGMHNIYLSEIFSGKGIGLIPLSESIISSKGLKWNLDKTPSKVGGDLISTSNQIDDSNFNNIINIFVESGEIIITLEIKSLV